MDTCIGEFSSKYERILFQCIITFESYESLLSEFGDPSGLIDHNIILQKIAACLRSMETLLDLEVDEISLFQTTLMRLKYHLTDFGDLILLRKNRDCSETSNTVTPSGTTDSMNTTSVQNTVTIPRASGLNDVVGLSSVKKMMKISLILPKQHPQLFENRKVCNRILLFGPPGTGKTLLVHAIAAEMKAKLHSISASDILSPMVGESEKTMKCLFQYARESTEDTIIFIDEIDAFCRKRSQSEQNHSRRLITEIMCQMSSIEEYRNIFIIGATNCPWDLDSAIMRRFQKQIFMSLPRREERLDLLKFCTENSQLKVSNCEKWDELLDMTEGLSSSDLTTMVQNAMDIPVNELMETKLWKKTIDDYYEPANVDDDALKSIFLKNFDELPDNSVRARPLRLSDLISEASKYKPSVSIEDMAKYELFSKKL